MTITIVTAAEMQKDFEKHLKRVMAGEEIVITINGQEVGRLIPKDATVSFLADSLVGILEKDYDLDEAKAERMRQKYGAFD